MPTHVARQVQALMTERGMNPKHLARAAGLGMTYVRDLLAGRSRNPRTAQLQKLADALEAPLESLLPPGKAPMRGIQVERLVRDEGPSLWTTAITEVDVHGGMGSEGGLVDQERALGEWQMPTEWLRQEVRGSLNNIKIITLEGDSMAETLGPGDKVVVDLNRTTPSPPGIFVVWDGIALVAKRLEYLGQAEPPAVRITSDNPRYAPYQRTMDEIRVVGRIMGRWQRLS